MAASDQVQIGGQIDGQIDGQEQGLSGFRIQAVFCAITINLLDGFDVLAISFAAPSIATQWALSPERLGLLFSVGLLGMVLASVFVAGIADYVGRRRAILASLILVTVGMIGSALSESVTTLASWRFLVGAGVGIIVPSLNTLVAEFAPAKRRDFAIAAMQSGYPAGGILGGLVAVVVISSMGWRGIFWVGAGLSLVAWLAALRFLPESMDFLIARRTKDALPRLNAIRSRLALPVLTELPPAPERVTNTQGYRALLTPDVALRTAALSLAFFFVMASFYFVANWTPKLLVDSGLKLSVGLSGGIVLSLGGIFGGLLLGWFAARYHARILTAVFMLLTAPAMWVFSQNNSLELMLASAFVMGIFLLGSMVGLYVLTPGLFAAPVRATATGVGVGLGRLGAIVGPLASGYLIASDWNMTQLYGAFGLPVLLSAGMILWLHRHILCGVE